MALILRDAAMKALAEAISRMRAATRSMPAEEELFDGLARHRPKQAACARQPGATPPRRWAGALLRCIYTMSFAF